MAGFRTHITVSTVLGFSYGAVAVSPLGFSSDAAILAAGLTAIGGMLPDLDSDSGRPLRELSGLAGAAIPVLLLPRFIESDWSREATLATMGVLYFLIRYCTGALLCQITVHRGMFHSLPAMLIAGLMVYVEYGSPDRGVRVLLAVGVMLGFLSHLILDEIYSVDIHGVRVRLKKSAGSAVKLFSPSWKANAICYGILLALGLLTRMDLVTQGNHHWGALEPWIGWTPSPERRLQ